MLTKEQIQEQIRTLFSGNRPEVNSGEAIATCLENILNAALEFVNTVGELSELNTDHKSNLVAAINELSDILETPELEISFNKTSTQLKEVYSLCTSHPQLCREVVFYNANDGMSYVANGWKIGTGVIDFHLLMSGDGGVVISAVVTLSSNGTLSVR